MAFGGGLQSVAKLLCGCQARISVKAAPRAFNTTAVSRLNEFQKNKIMTEFSVVYDRNKDGYIDRGDIDGLKKALTSFYVMTRGENFKQDVKGYDHYWNLFQDVADENHDGKLSKDEWIHIWTTISDNAKSISFKNLPQWVRLMPYVIFPIMDFKGDGTVDGEEYKTFWYEVGGIKASSAFVQNCMNVMTENGKYTLNMHRFQALYADFYLSKSNASPGKYISGPVDYD